MERLLSDSFAEFHEELVRLKRAATDGSLAAVLGTSGGARDLAASVSARLRGILSVQAQRLKQEGNQRERGGYDEACYFMVALADEVLGLTLAWDGAPFWNDNLLERALFGKAVAGRDVYEHIDRILETRAADPVTENLAAVALMCLQLGFEGQLSGVAMQAQRERYRHRLLHFVGRARAGETPQAPSPPLFAAAYEGLIGDTEDRRLAPMRRWYRFAAIAAAAYLVVSTLVWFAALRPLAPALPNGGALNFLTGY